ncbi:MAG: hypothetical protein LKM32_10910 [Chiayiivirga sp.]|jgi:hypothetical protein|uniref:hypothetical protein n=1 Tax=Chiayiivirga sp. TaxID=2041042 RepID=UPI0025C69416|nr:hypothetical protein [Chiayiivirga sp.]MCI1709830.1 hypothetical protein [Chiayiivirga sp.]MCI1729861.1 hypothetical protein [Chiayiivirga sp.]
MNPLPIEHAKDPDLRHSFAALRRAAVRARDVAAATHTELVIVREGIIELVAPATVDRVHEPRPPYPAKP